MLQRAIPSTGELLPALGLGTWKQFDVGASAAERDPLRQVLLRLTVLGGKMIDSSPMYGRSETVVGDLTANPGFAERFFFATKVWTSGREEGIQQMEASFQKMRRNTMDLMQIHNLVDWSVHLKTLREWKEKGRIRYLGITHYQAGAHEALEQIIRSEPIDFVQFNYSIQTPDAEKRLLGVAQEFGVATIINEPLGRGDLFRHVEGKPLPAWAAEYDIHSWSQFFLKYVLSHPAVTCAIPGTSDPDHLIDNMAAVEGRLPDEPARRKMAEFFQHL